MKPPFRYHGSKNRAAAQIARLLPDHYGYVEPFGGAAAVLLAKAPARGYEVYNDFHGDLVNFYRVLRDQPAALARMCRFTPYARLEFETARASYRDRAAWETLSDLERARRWWLLCNQSYRPDGGDWGAAWQGKLSSGHSIAAQDTALWHRRISDFPALAARLARVHIECRDWQAVVAQYDTGPGTVIYCDPPYGASVGTNRYQHGAMDYGDFAAWAHEAAARGATVAVSGYAACEYAPAFADWPVFELSGQSALSGIARTELLWISSAARQLHMFDA